MLCLTHRGSDGLDRPNYGRESPAPERSDGARTLEEGGCGGFGWRQRRGPEGPGNDDGGAGAVAVAVLYLALARK
jgi:hypothetical protein